MQMPGNAVDSRESEPGSPSDVPGAGSEPHFLRRHVGKLAASVVITAGMVYVLQRGGLSLWPEGADFASVRWWTVPAYVVTLVVLSYFRAVRWRFLLRGIADVPRQRLIVVSWVGFAAILILPFRLGEIVRPYMLRQKGKVSMTAATGSVVAERVIDGLYLSAVLAVALLTVPTVDPLPTSVVGIPVSVAYVRDAGFVVLGIFTAAFVTIGVFYFARAWAHRVTLATVGIVSRGLAGKLATTAEKLASGLHFFSSGRAFAGFIVETTLYWGINALGMWLLAWGCGVVHADGTAPSFGEACALMGMLGVAILVPGPPGLLGTFQTGIYCGMTMYYPTSVVVGPGAAYVFVLYAVQLGWQLVAGGACLAKDRAAARTLAHKL